MPIIERAKLNENIRFGQRPDLDNRDEGAAIQDVFKAAFKTENTVGSYLNNDVKRSTLDKSYDPFKNIDGYEIHAERFSTANTDDDVSAIKTQIDKENQNRQLLESSGALGVTASLTAGILDPINFVPVGGAATKAYSVGGSILKGATTTARAGIIGATVAEAALHQTQETRTLGESAVNVAGSAFLSGILGGAVGAIGAKGVKDLGIRVENDLNVPAPDKTDLAEPNSVFVGGDLSAAAVRGTTIEEETLKKAWGTEKLFSGLKLNPKLRLATSPSVESRRFIQELAETPFFYEKNDLGIANPTALESIIDMQNARMGTAIEGQKKLYKQYKERVRKEGGDVSSYLQFREEAGRAARRNDEHSIPEIAETARLYRKEVLDPLKEAAIKVGLLDENVKVRGSDTYLHRWWDRNVVAARRDELKNIIYNGLRTLPEIKTKDGFVLDNDELLEISDEVINNILGVGDIRLPYDMPISKRGPLKERKLDFIRDSDIESFLVNDIEAVSHKYLRTMSPDIAIKDWFGDLNITGKDGFITSKINDDYNKLAEGKTEKQKVKLQKQRESDLRDIEAVVGQLRGTFGMPDNPDSIITRAGRVTREVQYLSKLGGVTASSFPDVARPVMVHGFSRVFGDGIKPLIKNMRAFKLAAKEVKLAGTAWDMVMDGRAMTLAEINNPYVTGTKFEKGLHALSQGFGKVTLMTQWNTMMKQFTGVVTQARIIDGVRAGSKVSKKDSRYLAQLGINAQMAKRISKQIDEFGNNADDITIANTNSWTDLEAQTVYRAALKKEVDKIIVTPGVGDLPLILKETEMGKLVGQFRSFSFAATNRVLIAGLQESDAQMISGMTFAVIGGMMAYAFKTWDRGKELSDDPRVWIAEGVDRSGLLGILGEVNQLSNKLTRGTISMQSLAGAPPLTRYASANVLGVLAGPTVGTTKDVAQVLGSASTGEWTASDSRALRRILPYQNLILLRRLFDEIEKGINDSLGVKDG